jgi:hypothetical protein
MPLLSLLLLVACAAPSPPGPDAAAVTGPSALGPEPAAVAGPAASPSAPWLAPASATVATAFPLPPGAEAIETDAFGRSLLDLPLRPPGTPVRLHDGRERRTGPVRVVDLPLVRGDLQQCADTAIRLRAEWLLAQGRPVSFHATSGDAIPWSRVERGEIPYAEGRGLKWRAGRGDWDTYLRLVFTWAGTASLVAYETVPATAPRAGDMLVQGGFPGHAVVVLAAAGRGDETLLLLGQGFMPAQDMHVLVGPVDGWWRFDDPIALPDWTFRRADLRRWREG